MVRLDHHPFLQFLLAVYKSRLMCTFAAAKELCSFDPKIIDLDLDTCTAQVVSLS